jgi:hypothetical protein
MSSQFLIFTRYQGCFLGENKVKMRFMLESFTQNQQSGIHGVTALPDVVSRQESLDFGEQ